MRHLAIAFAMLVLAVPAFASPGIETIFDPSPGGQPDPNQAVWSYPSDAVVLYDNGPLITNPNVCAPPAVNDSKLQTGDTVFGFGHAISAGIRVADDFRVPQGQCWDIQAVTFFAYQTGATTPTINNVNFRIWNQVPNVGNVGIIYGDTSTNVLAAAVLSGIRRTNSTANCAGDRLVMADRCLASVQLNAGQYWIDWQSGGTLASGPWAPPITLPGGGVTGDGLQFIAASGWLGILNGTSAAGLPFILEGFPCTTPVDQTTWGAIKNLY